MLLIDQAINGDRPGVPNYAVIFTDGKPQMKKNVYNVDETVEEAEKLRNDSTNVSHFTTMFVVHIYFRSGNFRMLRFSRFFFLYFSQSLEFANFHSYLVALL